MDYEVYVLKDSSSLVLYLNLEMIPYINLPTWNIFDNDNFV